MRAITSRSLLVSGGQVIAVRGAGALLMLALLYVTARFFDTSTLGATGVLWSIALIGRVGGPLGLDVLGMRRIAPLWASGRDEAARQASEGDFRWLARIYVPVIALALVACCVFFATGAGIGWMLAALGAACFSANALQGLVSAQLRAAGHLMASQAPESMGIPLLALAGTMAVRGASTLAVVAAQSAAILLVSLWYSWVRPGRASGPMNQGYELRSMVAVAGATIATAVALRVPVIIVASFGLHRAGLYDAGQRMQAIVALGVTSASVVVTPRLAVLVPSRRLRDAAHLVIGAGTLAAVPGFVMLATFFAFPHLMGDVLGTRFSLSQSIAIALLVAATVNAMTSLCGNLLIMMHGENAFFVIAVLHMTVLVICALFVASDPLKVALVVMGVQVAREATITLVTIIRARRLALAPRRELVAI
jgi:hypothetical protein